MAIIVKTFNGKLNLDVYPDKVPLSDYIDSLNITRDAQGIGADNVVSNIQGNRQVLYMLPAGTSKRIGSHADPVRNRIYYFVWNSNGFNLMLYYDKSTDTIVKLIEDLTDTNNVPVLKFNPSWRINHVDIIYKDEGDLIAWTEGLNSPRKINDQHILTGKYPIIKEQFIEVAKRPPLSPPLAVYGNDTTRNSNSLRRFLFQFMHWFKCDDFEETSISTYSKIPLPIGFYGSDNDIDNQKNNFITLTVETGDENVTDIKIGMRNNIDNAWSTIVLIASLNKAQLNIPNNSTYQFLFYNDALYPPTDTKFQILLYDWVPKKAYTQCLPNGNVLDYGGITENFNNYPVNELDVTITAENVTNIPPDATPPSITYTQSGETFNFKVNGNVPTGTKYQIYVYFNGTPPTQTRGVRLVGDYTSIGGNTINDVANALYNDFNSYPSVPIIIGSHVGNTWQSTFGAAGTMITQIIVIPGTSGGATISTEKVWLPNCNYLHGIVYVDEQNRDMPGVTTFINPVNSDKDFIVTTPQFSEDTGVWQTPVIHAAINHAPMVGAVKFYWVRRRLQYADFIFYETCDYQDGTDTDATDNHLYFCLANIEAYKKANSQFIYGSAPINSQSRIKIIAGISSNIFNGDIWTQDYQILGTVIRTLTGGVSPDDDVLFIKVKKPDGSISPAYTFHMMVMVYTPALNPTDIADSVYWEWGEAYDIYTLYTIGYKTLVGTFQIGETITGGTSGATGKIIYDDGSSQIKVDNVTGTFLLLETITGGTSGATSHIDTITPIKYHRGKNQDQTALQPATFIWPEGDVYFHQRTMYKNIVASSAPFAFDTISVMDANFSDFFISAVNDNGRGQAIAVNAKETFYPTLDRFSLEYESDTTVNNTNRFYFDNADEYDRSFGKIKKQYIEGRYKYVEQEFDIGVVPILTQIVKDTASNPLQANSDQLLNKIQYPYAGKVGIGDVPESFAQNKYAKYGVDSNKAVVWRLSQDGVIVLSVLYETNAFFVAKLAAFKSNLNNGFARLGGVYTGDPTVYGVFDSYTNKYIVALEEINRYDSDGNLIFHQDAYTFSFLETRDESEGFESPLSYHPEGMDSLDNLLVSFKNGNLWKHDSDIFCNFYGVQYDAYVTGVFNDKNIEKKTWENISLVSGDVWVAPLIYTNVNTYETPFSQRQESRLIEQNFKRKEQNWHASFKRDIHSRKGLINGNFLKGNFIVIKLQAKNPAVLSFLSEVYVRYIDSSVTVIK